MARRRPYRPCCRFPRHPRTALPGGNDTVLLACWAAKGGAGTTVVATALARVLASGSPSGALLADLAGDVPAVLGLPDPPGPGLAGWLAAGEDVPPDALGRLEVEGPAGLRILPWAGEAPAARPPGLDERASVPAAVL